MADGPEHLAAGLAGRYRLERELGRGGMAVVYLAEDLRHHRKVAIKVLRPELAAVIGAERFLAEIRTTAHLQHPQILPLHDSGQAAGQLYYVMPYVEGETLRRRLDRERPLPIDEAVRIARDVAAGLDYAHRHGVVHRDIKPANILLHEGQALIADFGIALAVTAAGGQRMTETGLSLGTPEYMSPEQTLGERAVTAKSDVYALGCVLYEMLAGEPPFTGPTVQAIFARVMTEDPRPLHVQRRSVPAHVEAAVFRALEKLPADRFGTAAHLASALADPAFAAEDRPRGAPARRPRGARRVWTAVAPWAALTLATGAAVLGWIRRPEAPVSRHRIALWERLPERGAVARNLAISPDGSFMAYGQPDTGGPLLLKERPLLEPVPIRGTEGARAPAFSPDGRWIAFVAEGRLKKVPRAGGAVITVADSANTSAPAVAWLKGGHIAFNHANWHLELVPEDGGPPRRVFSADGSDRGTVAIAALPRGRGLLFVTCPAGCAVSELRVFDLDEGAERELSKDVLGAWHTDGRQVVMARRDGSVVVAPFDLKTLTFRSEPVPLFEGVRTASTSADMVLSAGGTMVYAPGDAGGRNLSELVWVARDGATTPVDSGWTFVPSGNGGLSLSPDGRKAALSIHGPAGDDIWVKDLDRGVLGRLTFEGSNVTPEWTEDGRSVMYSAASDGENANVRIRSADGTGEELLLVDLASPIYGVRHMPGQESLLIRTGSGPSADIVLVTPGSDRPPVAILGEPFREFMPAVSPDGRFLAYTSDESGRREVYVRPLPAVTAARWQVSRAGGSEPVWGPAAGELFYRDGAGYLVAIDVVTAPSFGIRGQRVLFSVSQFREGFVHTEYDVAPDGRRFLFSRPAGGPAYSGTLVLVENLQAEIRAAAGR